MNDIEPPPLPTTSATPSATPTAITAPLLPRRVADPPGTANEPGIRLTWRRLDRLASAATLGVILASPRTALLVERAVGPRVPPVARSVGPRVATVAPGHSCPSADSRRQRFDR